ncbi:hypothetical protein LguiB_001817 [Lonicera macranthoides]
MEEEEKKECCLLSKFVVGSVPTLFYIPDFITDSEHHQLLNNISQAPVSKWKSLKNRRLQNWGGVVHAKGLLAQDLPPWLTRITRRISEESKLFPSAINHVLINEYLPNQGIMPHQDGPAYFPVVAILSLGSPVVMEFTPHSTLADNKSGSQTRLPFSIVLMPRSLLIFKDMAYSEYLHGIKDCEVQQCDGAINLTETLKRSGVIINQLGSGLGKANEGNRGEEEETGDSSSSSSIIHRSRNRISLTCRVVTKVHKNLFKF